jgi:hypothetical protein
MPVTDALAKCHAVRGTPMRMHAFFATSLVIALCGLTAVEAAESGMLTDAEIKAMFSNTTRQGTTADGTPWTIVSNSNGTESIVAGKDNSFRDSAVWVIRNGAACETWNKIENGKETCWRFQKLGDNEYHSIRPNGQVDSTFSVIKH